MRGLARTRHLRCGRCGADWKIDVLRCSFCDNRDHQRLRSLVPEKGGDSRKVDACDACRGYLKSLAQLAPLAPELIPLEDLGSVELDLAAIDRDYRRPDAPAARLGARVEP
jgi:FdhE protein